MPFEIRMMKQSDAPAVAWLHISAIPQGFLSSLGAPFLTALYRGIARTPRSAVFVAHDMNARGGRNLLAGFISGTMDTSVMYRTVLARQWPYFTALLVPTIFNLKCAIKICETLRYGLMPTKDQLSPADAKTPPRAELLAVAVAEHVRGKGLGNMLVHSLEKFFLDNASGCTGDNLFNYKAITLSTDPVSKAFYRSCGFTLNRQFKHHKNIMNEYVKSVVPRL